MRRRSTTLLLSVCIVTLLAVNVAYAATPYVFLKQFGSSGSGDGQFSDARGILLDKSGHVFVADLVNARVEEFTTSGSFVGWLGACFSGTSCDTTNDHSLGFSCTSATCSGSFSGNKIGQFSNPRSLASDSASNIYVVDQGNNRVQVFTHAGTFNRTWGSFGSGDGQFDLPTGIALDAVGNVYVADEGNSRVEKFTNAGTFVGWLGGCSAGTNCDTVNQHSLGFACTAATCTLISGNGDGQFIGVTGIAIDASGNFYTTEGPGNRVDKFDSSGGFLGWGGVCNSGANCVTATQTSVGFTCSLSTCFVSVPEQSGSGSGQFSFPQGIAVGPGGNIFVADEANFRVQKFMASGTFLISFGSNGCGGGQFEGPTAVAVGTLVYVTDTDWPLSGCGSTSDRVEVFSLPPTSTTVTCTPSTVPSGSPTTCTATVSDIGSTTGTPKGTVTFKSNLAGSFSSTKCTLSGTGTSASCSVTFTPSVTGTAKITATYSGDGSHSTSQGSFKVTVT